MLDRILQYLRDLGRAAPAEEILRSTLNIHVPNAFTADKILRGILAGDDRFRYSHGLWQVHSFRSTVSSKDIDDASFVFLEPAGSSRYWICMRGALYASRTDSLWEFSLAASAPSPDMCSLCRLREASGNNLLVAWKKSQFGLWNRLLLYWGLEPWRGRALGLLGLATRILEVSPAKLSPENMAAVLGLVTPDTTQPGRMARFMASCFSALLARVPEEPRRHPAALLSWIEEGGRATDFSRFAFGKEDLRQLPTTPGVYVMRSRAGKIIYVGKSGNLRRRVSSYFSVRRRADPKVTRILQQLHSLEVVPSPSEIEALLLEMRMIRDFHPAINLQTDIHEQAGTYGKDQNLILLVAERGTEKVQVYFLKEGVFAGQESARLACPAPSALREKVRTIYFGKRLSGKRKREPWEREIIYRWLAANRRKLNFVDVNDAGSCEEAVRQLDAYLRDADNLLLKVHYR